MNAAARPNAPPLSPSGGDFRFQVGDEDEGDLAAYLKTPIAAGGDPQVIAQ